MNNTHSDRPSYRGGSTHNRSPRPDSPPLPTWVQAFRRRRRTERRGVLLLLMLSLLVLFAVVGVTYVLLSSQFRRIAGGPARIEQYAVDSAKQLDEAAMQVFRGSNSPLSVLSIHSLLEDMNGNDAISSATTFVPTFNPPTTVTAPLTIYSAVSSFQNAASGQTSQLIDLTLQQVTDTGTPPPVALPVPLPWPMAAYYSGLNSSGSPNPTSAAQPLSGAPPYYYLPFVGKGPSNVTSLNFPITTLPATSTTPATPVTTYSIAPSGSFNGCLLTFTSGSAAGQSTRIVGYDSGLGANTTGIPTLRVMEFPAASSLIQASVNNKGATKPTSLNVQFVINGRPFSGTGFGFNTATSLVDNQDTNARLYALLPNPVTFIPNTTAPTATNGTYTLAGGIGGADEDYDAADWNNMLLGLPLDPRDVISTPYTNNNSAGPQPASPPYPSLHRPELVNYWINTWITNAKPANSTPPWPTFLQYQDVNGNYVNLPLARQISLRPLGYYPTCTPATTDHPNFTGSNSNPNGYFDPVNGPWDVDTDGDGIADSIWVDLGMPVQTAPDGTTFKPLFAIRVLDMDGRLNVNAHGNSAQVEAAYSNAIPVPGSFPSASGTPSPTLPPSSVGILTANPAKPTLGSGYGTAEINLQPLFNEQSSPPSYQNLLAGNGNFEGRNGELTTATGTAYDSTVVPSGTTPPYPGLTNSNDVEITASNLGLIKHWNFPFPGSPTMLTAYGSAPDLWGRCLTALDIGGAPLMPSMSGTATTFQPFESTTASWQGGLGGPYDTLSNPYTLNLSRTTVRGAKSIGATDNPFTPAELERILRSNDADVGALPPRLAALLANASPAALALLRRQVTTDSWDLPSPNFLSPQAFAVSTNHALPSAFPFASSAADLLSAQMFSPLGGWLIEPDLNVQSGAPHANWNDLNVQLQLMLPPELLSGQRFDINRPFGNGRDDDGDGVVDEPDEYKLGEPAWVLPNPGTAKPQDTGTSPFANNPSSGPSSTPNAVYLAVDWNGDGTIDANDALMARHIMARHLYMLAMMSVDPNLLATSPGLSPWYQQNSIQYDADGAAPTYFPAPGNIFQVEYALAQWAINCVDFLDRDSVMTPFEFDTSPFDGWGFDGVVGNGTTVISADDDPTLPNFYHRGLVWGCERPELLITETLAWHDRRTQDLSADSGTVAASKDMNNDFDQQLLPMPACFIELYNPWTTQYSNRSTAPLTVEQTNAPAAAEVAGEFYYDKTQAAYAPYTSSTGTATYPNAQPPTGVVLNKFDSTTGKSPVWRLIFVNNGLPYINPAAPATNPAVGATSPDPRTLDPDDPMLLVNTNTQNFGKYIDRIVYFVSPPAGGYPAGFPMVGGVPSLNCAVHYPSLGQAQASLKPGRYAVVGSAGGDQYPAGATTMVSKLGRNTANTSDSNAAPINPGPDTNGRRIALTPNASTETNQVQIFGNIQNAAEPAPLGGVSGTDAQPAIAIALDTAMPSGGTAVKRSFGISDPVGGYPIASTTYNGAGEPLLATIQPQPLDKAGDQQMLTNQTITGYRTVHLQRLADPNQGYDATLNPYLTIDSASVDVTAFNGVSPTQDPPMPYPIPAGAPAQSIQSIAFCSTQRGDQYAGTSPPTPPTNIQPNVLWAHEYGHTTAATGVLGQKPTVNVSTSLFTPSLYHSLGYLNQMYGIASANSVPTYTGTYTAAVSTAFTAKSGGGAQPAPIQAYAGSPTVPFPWLTWNNRPYVTPLELALVPKSRSSRLLFDYSGTATGNKVPMYSSQSGAFALYPQAGGGFGSNVQGGATSVFFGHQLNFFDAASPIPANLYRLFEYVQVPSRFVGTETILNPVAASSPTHPNYGIQNATPPAASGNPPTLAPTLLNGDFGATAPASTLPTYTLGSSPMGTYVRPPLNKVSEYRDPGRVNINTVQDPVVWQGALNGSYYPQLTAASGANVAATVNTRADSSDAPAVAYGGPIPTDMPSYFSNPFRSFAGAVLTNSIYASQTYMPLGFAPFPNGTGTFPSNALRDIEATLLRPEQIGIGPSNVDALFDSQSFVSGLPSINVYNDPTRSFYFRLQNASRMSNLLTTRSNVYAVWITVGNFQVTPWYGPTPATPPVVTYDTADQDGYQLGQELGSDTGQIKRHRAFYIFDRTIPVGFERGVDHNVKDAILLRRYIE